jgi:hypothetical protein
VEQRSRGFSIEVRVGEHSSEARSYFSDEDLGPFRSPQFLRAMHGEGWQSVLLSRGGHAMLHCRASTPIAGTGYADAEAWTGYGGPLFTRDVPAAFVADVLDAYSDSCRRSGLIAETVRFDPAKGDETKFSASALRRLVYPRRIVVKHLPPNASDLIRTYSEACTRRINRYSKQYRINACLPDSEVRDRFHRLLLLSMARVGAIDRWRLARPALDSLCDIPETEVIEVTPVSGGAPVSAALCFFSKPCAHSFLVANEDPKAFPSACDVLMHAFLARAHEAGSRIACLGGGGTLADDDTLLRYKLRFSPRSEHRLAVGVMIHNPAVYDELCHHAEPSSRIDPVTAALFPYKDAVPRHLESLT